MAPTVTASLDTLSQGLKLLALSEPHEPGFLSTGWSRTLRGGIQLGLASFGEVLRAYGVQEAVVDRLAQVAEGVAAEVLVERMKSMQNMDD